MAEAVDILVVEVPPVGVRGGVVGLTVHVVHLTDGVVIGCQIYLRPEVAGDTAHAQVVAFVAAMFNAHKGLLEITVGVFTQATEPTQLDALDVVFVGVVVLVGVVLVVVGVPHDQPAPAPQNVPPHVVLGGVVLVVVVLTGTISLGVFIVGITVQPPTLVVVLVGVTTLVAAGLTGTFTTGLGAAYQKLVPHVVPHIVTAVVFAGVVVLAVLVAMIYM